jgi:carbon starvation protein
MLAAIALTLGAVVLFKMQRQRYAAVAVVPASWLAICTLTAGWEKIFSPLPAIGFLAHADKFAAALAAGKVLAPAKSVAQMRQVLTNDYVDCGLTALFMTVVVLMLGAGAVAIARALGAGRVTTEEQVYGAA